MKRVYCACTILILCLCGWKCGEILFLCELGKGQAEILFNSIPVDAALRDTSLPDSVKAKLAMVPGILQFAIAELGLDPTDNYYSFYDSQGKPLLWVVTGSERYALDPFKWKYPLLGELAYRGYFDRREAVAESLSVAAAGYDVSVDPVNAWSTLGWFPDPILSGMLNRSEGELARLLIHELTHSTFYIAGDADSSENIATFIGDRGALLYMEKKYGSNSEGYHHFKNTLDDIGKFSAHILRGASRLDSLYSNFNLQLTSEQKDRIKYRIIGDIFSDLDTVHFNQPGRFGRFMHGQYKANNAFFTGFLMYRHDQQTMERALDEQFNNDLPAYIRYLRAIDMQQ